MPFNRLVDEGLSADDIKLLRLVDPNFQRFAVPQRIESLQTYAPVYNLAKGDSDTLDDIGTTETAFSTTLNLPNEIHAGDCIEIRVLAEVTGVSGTPNATFKLKADSDVLLSETLATPAADDFIFIQAQLFAPVANDLLGKVESFGTEGGGTYAVSADAASVDSAPGKTLSVSLTFSAGHADNAAELFFVGFTHSRGQSAVLEVPTAE